MSRNFDGYRVPNYDSLDDGSSVYSFQSKIMVTAFVVLCFVLIFIFLLHVYAKWFWRPHFVGHESFRSSESVGLGKHVIDSLPTFTYKQPESQEEVVDCAVCLCEFQEDEKVRLLPKCNHIFHNECIDMWLYTHSSCPLCRTGAGPEPTPNIEQDGSTDNYVFTIVPENLDSSDINGNPHIVVGAEGSASPRQATQGAELFSLPPPVSISDRFQKNFVMEYPTNVLFWGDHMHVNAHVTYPQLERVQRECISLPHITIDLPRGKFDSPRLLSCNTPRRGGNFSSPGCLCTSQIPIHSARR